MLRGEQRRRAFCTDGSAVLAFASGRARRSTLAGLAAIVISSPVAGLRPWRFFWAGLTRNGQLPHPPDPYLLGIAELLERDLLERGTTLRFASVSFSSAGEGVEHGDQGEPVAASAMSAPAR